jgi:hypothetical protein
MLDSDMIQKQNTEKDIRVVKSYSPTKQKNTIILTIPQDLAKRYGFEVPQHLLLVPHENGILIRKMELKLD